MRSLSITFFLAALISILGLSACLPHGMPEINMQEINMNEAPADPLVRAVESRRRSFAGLKGIAEVSLQRQKFKRSFDTVGIIIEAQKRLRMEAFGPLGESLFAVLWTGKDVELAAAEGIDAFKSGVLEIERLLGDGIGIKDLCAALSGDFAEGDTMTGAKAFCGADGGCILEIRGADAVRRIRFVQDAGAGFVMSSYELYRDNALIYRARFENMATLSQYRMPMLITMENPSRKVNLTVKYGDLEVNAGVGEDAFRFQPGEASAP